MTEEAATTPVPTAARRSSAVGRRQGLSPSPTLSAFGDEEGDAGAEDEEGGFSCRLLREEGSVPGDPVVVVGYTLVTRSKAQTFRILNAELRCVFVCRLSGLWMLSRVLSPAHSDM